SDARDIVSWIERMPGTPEICLEPSGKIHRRGIFRSADVTQIAGAIPRGNVHAAAEGDGQVGEVAADALAVGEDLQGGLRGAREFVAELDVLVDEIANRLHAPPAERGAGEQVPSDLGHLVGLAVPTSQEEHQRLLR